MDAQPPVSPPPPVADPVAPAVAAAPSLEAGAAQPAPVVPASRRAAVLSFLWANAVWLSLGALGALLRAWLWRNSVGSNDVEIWAQHARGILAEGLNLTYLRSEQFNHPPLLGLYAAQAYAWAQGDLLWFARLLKLPGLLGEVLSFFALWRFASPRAAAAYALLPASILVSGFHGNTDCLVAALVLLAFLSFDRERYFLAGLLFGAALDVKVLPLVLAPLFLLGAPGWKALGRGALGLLVALLPFALPAAAVGASLYRNMLAYNSNPDNWGLIAFANASMRSPLIWPKVEPWARWYLSNGRYVVLLSITAVGALARWWRPLPKVHQAALGACLFLFFAPGFGVQYVVFAAPLLCLVAPAAGLRWGVSAGAFIGSVYWYFLISFEPLQSRFTSAYAGPAPLLGVVAWCVLGHATFRLAQPLWKRRIEAV